MDKDRRKGTDYSKDAARLLAGMDARKKASERLEGSERIQADNVIELFPREPREGGPGSFYSPQSTSRPNAQARRMERVKG